MKTRLIIAVIIGLTLITAARNSAKSNPEPVILAYEDALNAHDIDATLALFSDDLEYHDFGGLILDKGYMSESLKVWNPRLSQAEAIDIEVNGNKVVWLMRFIQRSGSIDEFQFEAIIEGEQITSLTELAVSIGSYSYRNPQYRGYFRRTAPTRLA